MMWQHLANQLKKTHKFKELLSSSVTFKTAEDFAIAVLRNFYPVRLNKYQRSDDGKIDESYLQIEFMLQTIQHTRYLLHPVNINEYSTKGLNAIDSRIRNKDLCV